MQTSPAALETSCFSASRTTQEPKQGLFLPPAPLLSAGVLAPGTPHPQNLKAPLLVAVQAPSLTLTGDGWAQGHKGAGPEPIKADLLLPDLRTYSQSDNPRPHSGLLERAQPCFRIPDLFQKLRLMESRGREGEGSPTGTESLDVGRGQWVQKFFCPPRRSEGRGGRDFWERS